ncbi:MAG: 50S ribosomal protein L22 [Candidatus Jacksonbacteria bacterium]|nr:50S ribosomal protein L22 [Candidatus Jacksonbacteria bacterium]
MEITAKLRHYRQSPRKVRLVTDLIRGKDAHTALNQLQFAGKRAALPIQKLLSSAMANAVNNFSLKKENLYVKKISVDGGPVLKRWMPRAFGRASEIRKRTSHVTIVLDEKIKTG